MSSSIYAPENIKNILKRPFINLGYTENHLHLDWPFVHPDLVEPDPTKKSPIVDLAAFTHPYRHNLDTTSIVVKIENGNLPLSMSTRKQIAEGLKYTLAPVLILVDSQKVDIWLNGNGYGIQHQETFELDEFTTEFPNKYRRKFSPQALAKVRGGQLTFFDMGYLDFSGLYHVTREALVKHFHEGVIKARQLLREGDIDFPQIETLSRVAISLLAARILEDKDYFGDLKTPTLDPHELLDMASRKADAFFTHTVNNDLSLFSDEVLQPLMAHLAGPITFRGVTEEMIGYFYEKALVSERRKRATGKEAEMHLKGIHYTPLKVAQNILNRIPLETIRPEKRHIIDPTCGSGSFLLAATDRLDNLYDPREISLDKKTYLEDYVTGNDIDPIAIQVARLSYLLNHVSKGNQDEPIEPTLIEKDALKLTEQDFKLAPSIIVGNPPFSEDPAQRDQIATRFLNKALELLPEGGYLAMIMPQSFLDSDRQGCPEVRQKLLENCELLEVWKMPEKSVGLEAEYPTTAILAFRSNGGKNKLPVRIYQTVSRRKKEAVSAIHEHGRFTFSYIVPNIQSWREHPKNLILTSPLESLWDGLQDCQQLGVITLDWSGITTRPNMEAQYSSKRCPGGRWELYLDEEENLEPYYIELERFRRDRKFVRYERKYVYRMGKSHEQDFLSTKLIVTSRTHKNAPVRFRAAIDEYGTFPGNNFRCFKIIPEHKEKYSLEWLVGVLNSPVAQAWAYSHGSPRVVTANVFRTIPLPETVNSKIAELVKQHRDANAEERETIREEIDRLVLQSYGISQEDWAEIERFIEGMINPWVEGSKEAHRHVGATQTVTGHVMSLQLSEQRIELFINAFCLGDETINICIPKFMPGWALRVGQAFKAKLDKCIFTVEELEKNPYALHDFRPLRYAYKSYGELVIAVLGKQGVFSN